ncbi:hypothetical protein V6N13_065538 [Hibiscus sabdariffa]
MESSKRLDRIVRGSSSVGGECTEVLNVAAKGKVIVASSGLSADKHRAMTMVDSDGGCAIQGRTRTSHKARKSDYGMKQNVFTDRLSPLMRDLDSTVRQESERVQHTNTTADMSVNDVDWHPNLAFKHPSVTDM